MSHRLRRSKTNPKDDSLNPKDDSPTPKDDSPKGWKKGVISVVNLRSVNQSAIEQAKKQHPAMKVLSFFWFIFCTTSFITHSILITTKYLEYDATTEVQTYFSRKFSPPVISVCRSLMELIKLTSDNYGVCKTERFGNKCQDYLFDFPVKEIMATKTTSLKDTVIEIGGRKSLSELESLRSEYYKSYLKCVRMSRSDEIVDFFAATGWSEGNLKTVMKVTLNISTIHSAFHDKQHFRFQKPFLGVIFHNFSSLPHYPDYDIYWYDIDRKEARNSYQFTFDKHSYLLLPSPYQSGCAHYDTITYRDIDSNIIQLISRGHCLENCMQSSVYKKTGKRNGFFTASFLEQGDQKIVPEWNSLSFDPEINEKCFDVCPNDCLTVYFLPMLMNRYESINPDRFGIRLEMYRPQTKIRYSALFPLDSFLIFLASIAGLWFGLSIHSTVQIAVKRVCKSNYFD